jgi:hypothetical protein
MRVTVSKPALVLSTMIAVLATIASAGGLFVDGLYRDNAFVTSTWLGTDLVTLVVAIPLLIVAMFLASRGSARAYLVWLGVLDSMLYNFGFYLFGASFNQFFMIYAALVAFSSWALFLGLVDLDVEKLSNQFSPRVPVRSISIYMLFVGLGLTSVYVAQWLDFIMSGQVPAIVMKSDHPTNVVFALDLTLVIPLLIVGALWLWRRSPWGYVVAAIVNVKGAIYMLGLCTATLAAYQAGTVQSPSEITLWGSIGVGCLIASVILLRNLTRVSHEQTTISPGFEPS